jgi:hypothetical protein
MNILYFKYVLLFAFAVCAVYASCAIWASHAANTVNATHTAHNTYTTNVYAGPLESAVSVDNAAIAVCVACAVFVVFAVCG